MGRLLQRYSTLLHAALERELNPLQLPSDPEALSHLVGGTLQIPNPERQRLLELLSTKARLELERELLNRESSNLQEFIEQRKGGMGPFSRN